VIRGNARGIELGGSSGPLCLAAPALSEHRGYFDDGGEGYGYGGYEDAGADEYGYDGQGQGYADEPGYMDPALEAQIADLNRQIGYREQREADALDQREAAIADAEWERDLAELEERYPDLQNEAFAAKVVDTASS
jgi:hypothetical protein